MPSRDAVAEYMPEYTNGYDAPERLSAAVISLPRRQVEMSDYDLLMIPSFRSQTN
jgi:hypothetical protein